MYQNRSFLFFFRVVAKKSVIIIKKLQFILITECDDGWELSGNRCWHFGIVPRTWSEARDLCHNNNAVLITIFNQAEQDYIDCKNCTI